MRRRTRLLPALLAAVLVGTLAVAPAAASGAATSQPVILIHGYRSSPATWDTLIRRLRAAGYDSSDIYAFGYDFRRSNVTTAGLLADYVATVREDRNAARVDLVGHSMGAVVARYYARHLGGTATVDDLVSLAGPHHGTRVLTLCRFTVACREMLPGSAFLRDLNAGDETPGGIDYRTFYSKCDLIVVPWTSALLDGAENTNAGCVGHTEFRLVDTLAKQVITELRT